MKTCKKCGGTVFIDKPLYCDFTDEAKSMGYKKGGNKEHGIIVNETKDGTSYRIRWVGIKASYCYPKEYIKII